jgi:hypothetical protein
MNRIILIGNGFDLAHGMKTSYKSFIDDYWANTIIGIQEAGFRRPFENDEIKISNSPARFLGTTLNDLENAIKNQKLTIVFKNKFLKDITSKSYLNNWVDVENEYYFLLKNFFQSSKLKNQYNISDLNADFSRMTELLQQYLTRIEKDFNLEINSKVLDVRTTIGNKIYSAFKLKDFSEDSVNQRAEIEYNLLKPNIANIKRVSFQNLVKQIT